MNRTDAEETARRLAKSHPQRADYRWLVRQDEDGEWIVVKVSQLPGKRIDPLKASIEPKPKPPEPDDPRPPHWKNVGGPYGPG
ncbi:MAG: hypothetical protein ABR581_09980 [Thermoleophilaceae bacterium]